MAYATTLELARFLNLENKVPDVSLTGQERIKEEVGTGDNSTSRFFLNYGSILAYSYSLFYGASESSATNELTETTHYVLDKDNGEINLTPAGITLLGTNKIYAKYSHLMGGDNLVITNTDLQNCLNRAEEQVDENTGTHFAEGNESTPDYDIITNEAQDGKGHYDTDYFLSNYPLPDVSTTLNGSVTSGDTTINVTSTNGFPESGVIGINKDKITYTSKTSTSFEGCSGVSNSHDDSSKVYPFVVEMSTSSEGSSITWTILERDIDYDLDLVSGRVHLYKDYSKINALNLQQPQYLVPNRFRCSYITGWDTIPYDIKRLTLMIAGREIENMRLRKMNIMGVEFSTTLNNIDDAWIDKTIIAYKSKSSSNI